jgi:outer membrane lipoprotein carrier protein
MELSDNFGQTTSLIFLRLESNPALPSSLFHFAPPAGVDIIGE